jgi:hypothetical protein
MTCDWPNWERADDQQTGSPPSGCLNLKAIRLDSLGERAEELAVNR